MHSVLNCIFHRHFSANFQCRVQALSEIIIIIDVCKFFVEYISRTIHPGSKVIINLSELLKGYMYVLHLNSLVRDYSISRALAMEILQSFTKPSISIWNFNTEPNGVSVWTASWWEKTVSGLGIFAYPNSAKFQNDCVKMTYIRDLLVCVILTGHQYVAEKMCTYDSFHGCKMKIINAVFSECWCGDCTMVVEMKLQRM